jgi:alpha-1,4-glucan:alpha-1,4-glucan 6-glycosyltransferase/4-alpha-glucanotransferase
MESFEYAALVDLAVRHGVETSYVDIEGVERTASPDALIQILRGLGVPIDDPRDAADLGRRESSMRWHRRLEPVVVAWDGRGSIVVRVPEEMSDHTFRLRVRTEGGETLSVDGALGRGPVVEAIDLEGRRHVARRLPLPEALPIGYHEIELEIGQTSDPETALLVCAPRRVHAADRAALEASAEDPADRAQDRTWGLFVPLYALHGRRSRGIGDLTDLRELIGWVGDRGGSVVGTLPLLAAFLDDPCEPSPYAPVSRLAWNEIYLDPAELPEVREDPSLRARWQGPDDSPLGAHVDFAAVMARKRAVLEPAAARCHASGGKRRDDLEVFRRARPELDQYARFRAVGERLRRPWPRWPEALRSGAVPDDAFDRSSYHYHLYVQWCLHQQLLDLGTRARGTGLGLYLDLPIGVHAHGFDTWRDPEAFVHGLSTGAPPDTLFAGGQNWAFPPLHPERLRADRYRHVIEVLRNHLRYAGVLRIDHVMGLHRLYMIPDGAPATQGVYVRYRPEELYAILSLESHRAKTVLIGENLGTVPPAVQHAMDAHGVHGMHVVQYAVRDDRGRALPPPSSGEVASLNTHDMPPFRGFWQGHDIEVRRDLGWTDEQASSREHAARRALRGALRRFFGEELALSPDADADEVLRASLVHLARSDARLVLVTLEDLWGELESQNVPGTYREHPNWCRRARHPVETWSRMPEVTEVLREIDRARRIHRADVEVHHGVTELDDATARAWRAGTHERIDGVLGAHPHEHRGQRGTLFAVWAPSAERVSVIGDWTGWKPDRCPLRRSGESGIWEGFVVGVEPGDTYKIHLARGAYSVEKADPVAFRAELAPRSASIVTELEHAWGDQAWMDRRRHDPAHPMSIYEVHLGAWRRVPEERNRVLGYRELAEALADHVERLGFTHVQLMPLTEHPAHDGWGCEPTGLFAPTSRHGTPSGLMSLVDHLHRRGIGVLFDWVATRLSAVGHGLARFDGTPLFERPGGFTFDHGRPEVRSFLVSSACYWVEQFHADGLRTSLPERISEDPDAIAFLRQLNDALSRRNPGICTMAEPAAAAPMVAQPTNVGGLGFDYRWDATWRDEILQYMARDPIHRRYHHDVLTTAAARAADENRVLAFSHDIVRRDRGSLAASMPGDSWHKLANLRLLYGYAWTQPGKKLLFMGHELGQWNPWSHDRSIDWHLLDDPAHRGIVQWVGDLNRLYRREPALHELDCPTTAGVEGLEWIEALDAERSVLAYMRHALDGRHDDGILVVCNFTPVVRHAYRVGVRHGGTWYEILNSDAEVYGGRGVGNFGRIDAVAESTHDRPHTLSLTLPPLSVLVLGRGPR